MKTLKELIADFILPNGKSLEDINKAFILSGFTEPEIRITVREALMSEEFYLFGMLVKVKSLKKSESITTDSTGIPKINPNPNSTKPIIPKKKTNSEEYEEWAKKIRDMLDEENKKNPFDFKPYYDPKDYYTYEKPKCKKCGMSLESVMGYVCGDSQCPTFLKATC